MYGTTSSWCSCFPMTRKQKSRPKPHVSRFLRDRHFHPQGRMTVASPHHILEYKLPFNKSIEQNKDG